MSFFFFFKTQEKPTNSLSEFMLSLPKEFGEVKVNLISCQLAVYSLNSQGLIYCFLYYKTIVHIIVFVYLLS